MRLIVETIVAALIITFGISSSGIALKKANSYIQKLALEKASQGLGSLEKVTEIIISK